MSRFLTTSFHLAGLAGLALSLSVATAQGQGAHPWIDPALLTAAKAEGSLIVYSSTNEQEGLPLFKMFEEATGIKVQYVRASELAAHRPHDDRVPRRPALL